MTTATTEKIKTYATDEGKQTTLLALMDYYNKDSLSKISEEQALKFLVMLESGEIIVTGGINND